jgi:hypothetical protein
LLVPIKTLAPRGYGGRFGGYFASAGPIGEGSDRQENDNPDRKKLGVRIDFAFVSLIVRRPSWSRNGVLLSSPISLELPLALGGPFCSRLIARGGLCRYHSTCGAARNHIVDSRNGRRNGSDDLGRVLVRDQRRRPTRSNRSTRQARRAASATLPVAARNCARHTSSTASDCLAL